MNTQHYLQVETNFYFLQENIEIFILRLGTNIITFFQ